MRSMPSPITAPPTSTRRAASRLAATAPRLLLFPLGGAANVTSSGNIFVGGNGTGIDAEGNLAQVNSSGNISVAKGGTGITASGANGATVSSFGVISHRRQRQRDRCFFNGRRRQRHVVGEHIHRRQRHRDQCPGEPRPGQLVEQHFASRTAAPGSRIRADERGLRQARRARSRSAATAPRSMLSSGGGARQRHLVGDYIHRRQPAPGSMPRETSPRSTRRATSPCANGGTGIAASGASGPP